AVVELGHIQLKGFIGWMFWSAVHIYFLIGIRNRFIVAVTWLWSYVTFKRGARLITEVPPNVYWHLQKKCPLYPRKRTLNHAFRINPYGQLRVRIIQDFNKPSGLLTPKNNYLASRRPISNFLSGGGRHLALHRFLHPAPRSRPKSWLILINEAITRIDLLFHVRRCPVSIIDLAINWRGGFSARNCPKNGSWRCRLQRTKPEYVRGRSCYTVRFPLL